MAAAAAAVRGGGGAKEKRIFIKLLHMCVCIWGGGLSLPDPATHACIFFNLTDRVGILWGRDRGRAVAGGNKWAKKVYFVRDNSLSFIIHRQVHP